MPRDRSETPSLTAELAGWLAGLRPEALPESTRHAARLALLDTMGAALHGRQEFWAETALSWARRGAGPPGNGEGLATVWGEAGPSLRPADAALVNGVAAHAFELDDFIAKLHPGAAVVPAALALAERLGSGGEAIETAVVAGYEVMVRASRALDPNAARLRGWAPYGRMRPARRGGGGSRPFRARRGGDGLGARPGRDTGVGPVRLQRGRRHEQAPASGPRGACRRHGCRNSRPWLHRPGVVGDRGRRFPRRLLRRRKAGAPAGRARRRMGRRAGLFQALFLLRLAAFLCRCRARTPRAPRTHAGCERDRASRPSAGGRMYNAASTTSPAPHSTAR